MARSSSLVRRYVISPHVHRRRLTTSNARCASTSPQRYRGASPAVAAHVSPKRFSDIPGPITLPILRHSTHILPRIGNFHHVVGLGLLDGIHRKYGDLVRLAKGSRKRAVVYVFDPEIMRQVYESETTEVPRWFRSPLEVHRAARNTHCTHYKEETKEVWTGLRALLQDGSFLNNYDKQFDDIAVNFTRRLEDLTRRENTLNKEIETELYRWAVEALGVVMFGRRLGCLDGVPYSNKERKLKEPILDDDSQEKCSLSERPMDECTPAEKLVRSIQDIANYAYLVKSEKTLKRDSETFNGTLKALDQHFNLVEHFLTKSIEDLKSGCTNSEIILLRKLTPLDNHLLPLIADALLAGIEPLCHSAMAMLFHFSLHAARQQRAHDELAWREAADHAGAIRPQELPYLAACVKEALRLHPATGGVVRRTKEEMVLGGYEIPVGVDIVLAHGVSSRSETEFRRAQSFVPERWHSQGWETVAYSQTHPCAALPFGINCPASRVVSKMLGSLAARVLEKYRLEWYGPTPNLLTCGVNRLQPPYYFGLQKAS